MRANTYRIGQTEPDDETMKSNNRVVGSHKLAENPASYDMVRISWRRGTGGGSCGEYHALGREQEIGAIKSTKKKKSQTLLCYRTQSVCTLRALTVGVEGRTLKRKRRCKRV